MKKLGLIALLIASASSLLAQNLKISQLPLAGSVNSSDLMVIVQGGVTKQISVSQLPSGGGGGGGTNVATTTISFSSTITTDFTTQVGAITNGVRKYRVVLTGNLTLANPANVLNDGQQGIWELVQDSTGGRTVTLGSQFGGSQDIPLPLPWSTAANARDYMTAIWDANASKWHIVGFSGGY